MAIDTKKEITTQHNERLASQFRPCLETVERFFDLGHFKIYNENTAEVVLLSPKEPISWKRALMLAYNSLVPNGCYIRLIRKPNTFTLLFFKNPRKNTRLLTGIILAAVTLFTVYVSGIALSSTGYGEGIAWSPIGYLLGLLIPLLAHELGHWLTLRHYRAPASLPYLLPAPPIQLGFIGTFGAVINLKWLPADSRGLSLSSIMGPLTGFIVALPFAYYGIKASVVLPASAAGSFIPFVPLVFMMFPSPPAGAHEVIMLSPMGFAAFVVFVVTFLNLIPIATLDGGHIIRALLGFKIHYTLSVIVVTVLFLASFKWPGFMLFALLAAGIFYLNRNGHPGTSLGIEDIDGGTALAGILFGLLFILTMPIPITG